MKNIFKLMRLAAMVLCGLVWVTPDLSALDAYPDSSPCGGILPAAKQSPYAVPSRRMGRNLSRGEVLWELCINRNPYLELGGWWSDEEVLRAARDAMALGIIEPDKRGKSTGPVDPPVLGRRDIRVVAELTEAAVAGSSRAVAALGLIGPQAKAAIPALEKLRAKTESCDRHSSMLWLGPLHALADIQPESGELALEFAVKYMGRFNCSKGISFDSEDCVGPTCVRGLRFALETGSKRISEDTIYSMLAANGRSGEEVADLALRSKSAERRLSYVCWVAGKRSTVANATGVLNSVLDDPDVRVRSAAAVALHAMGREYEDMTEPAVEAIPGLMLSGDIDPVCGYSPAGISPEDAAKAIRALSSDNPLIRANGIWLLSRSRPEAVMNMPRLLELLRDDAPSVRDAAAKVLMSLDSGAEDAIDSLRANLSDKRVGVRALSVRLLGHFPDFAYLIVPELGDLYLHDSSPEVRSGAESVIKGYGRSFGDAMPELYKSLSKCPSPGLAAALGLMGSAALPAVPALCECGSKDALGLIPGMGKEAVPQLFRVLVTGSSKASTAAAGVLGKMAPSSSGRPYESKDYGVRALIELGADGLPALEGLYDKSAKVFEREPASTYAELPVGKFAFLASCLYVRPENWREFADNQGPNAAPRGYLLSILTVWYRKAVSPRLAALPAVLKAADLPAKDAEYAWVRDIVPVLLQIADARRRPLQGIRPAGWFGDDAMQETLITAYKGMRADNCRTAVPRSSIAGDVMVEFGPLVPGSFSLVSWNDCSRWE